MGVDKSLPPWYNGYIKRKKEVFKMKRLTFDECPKTRVEFVAKWNADNVFRARAQYMGFNVLFDTVVFPNGKVAGRNVK